MYALYKEKINSDYSTLLGVWAIKINETDITSGGQVESFDISDYQLGYVDSQYIEAGKIAPDGQAYFDLVIDPENTDVSIIYEIYVGSDTEANANIQLISAENYFNLEQEGKTTENTNTEEYIDTVGNTYTSVIPIDKINEGYKNYIRLYFKWTNIDANSESDSTLAGTSISVPLQVNLKQYTGEVIGSGT
jgi:hypothetical protein